jgi:hypothetical protein
MGSYPVAVCYNARKYNTIQYSTVQYNKHNTTQHNTTHITQNNTRHATKPSIRKITKKKKKSGTHTLFPVKTQKQVEPKADESVLKTTRYTKHSVNHTIQYSITHISPRPKPHYRYIHITSHPALITFPSPHLEKFQLCKQQTS